MTGTFSHPLGRLRGSGLHISGLRVFGLRVSGRHAHDGFYHFKCRPGFRTPTLKRHITPKHLTFKPTLKPITNMGPRNSSPVTPSRDIPRRRSRAYQSEPSCPRSSSQMRELSQPDVVVSHANISAIDKYFTELAASDESIRQDLRALQASSPGWKWPPSLEYNLGNHTASLKAVRELLNILWVASKNMKQDGHLDKKSHVKEDVDRHGQDGGDSDDDSNYDALLKRSDLDRGRGTPRRKRAKLCRAHERASRALTSRAERRLARRRRRGGPGGAQPPEKKTNITLYC
ncbi:hypothetical protein QBC34DRAFT_1682 [Podospora aff. communis PSN243]|uniref:Uncharacterized protein n=1 Tax=Podospora aff. communis PSN243 TaxID=3040156 RepID=A0AAV9H6W9_9PEZI|nr:hypothetical protein QBC34DRAFT_1682 [Podospora aff. communis PSN243]